MLSAACRGMAPASPNEADPFFPERGESHRPGKETCSMCPVQVECEEYSQRTGTAYGMWAGKIKRRRRA